eukprot:3362951-Amphidinium_carterae.1
MSHNVAGACQAHSDGSVLRAPSGCLFCATDSHPGGDFGVQAAGKDRDRKVERKIAGNKVQSTAGFNAGSAECRCTTKRTLDFRDQEGT